MSDVSPFLAGYQSMHGPTISPVSCLPYLQLTNLQTVPSTIEQYSVASGIAPNGPWAEMIPLSLHYDRLYFVGIDALQTKDLRLGSGVYMMSGPPRAKLSHAVLCNPSPKLEETVKQPMLRGQSVKGWMAFAFSPTLPNPGNYFKISVRDVAGVAYSADVIIPPETPPNTATQSDVPTISFIGGHVDLSHNHLRIYGDPFP